MYKQKFYYIIPLATLIIGGLVGWYFHTWHDNKIAGSIIRVRQENPSYTYINSLLYTETPTQSADYGGLKSQISDYINTAKRNNLANSISVYFRDLNTGRWMGINENEKYEPSSMLKVLVMMSYLKKAEDNPNILTQKMYYAPTMDPGQYYKPSTVMKAGNYTVQELIKRMIMESDNDAVHILDQNNDAAFYGLYNTLQLPPIPEGEIVGDYMSPKSYSALFRTLYNSTYINNRSSNQALELLSHTSFTKGLVSGVGTTTVAHKFGEHTVQSTTGVILSRELHDCGIVYTKSPYMLCVMTKGVDFPSLESAISSISKITYTNLSR
jgi:beta-lactamase class A